MTEQDIQYMKRAISLAQRGKWWVNLENDMIAKYVEKLCRPKESMISLDFFQANGSKKRI